MISKVLTDASPLGEEFYFTSKKDLIREIRKTSNALVNHQSKVDWVLRNEYFKKISVENKRKERKENIL